MKILTINAKTYEVNELSFGLLVKLEKRGFSIADFERRPLSFLEEYIALTIGKPTTFVEEELDAHIRNGYSLDDIMDSIADCIEDSGFFQKTEVTADNKKKQSKKASKSNA